jgi:tRNA (guanine37-N1)-methyltransferase
VYWCSRLQPERDRLLDMLKKHETLMDLFCGVGPLAVRAARKGLHVIANDLNPDCYKYLV